MASRESKKEIRNAKKAPSVVEWLESSRINLTTKWIRPYFITYGMYLCGLALCVLSLRRFLDGPDESMERFNAVLHVDAGRKLLPSTNSLGFKLAQLSDKSSVDLLEEVEATHEAIKQLDKSVTALELELAANRAINMKRRLMPDVQNETEAQAAAEKSDFKRKKAFIVIGINTAFSSKKRRDSIRQTWMPQGESLKKLEEEKGIVVRFVIGHTATPGGILDHAIDNEHEAYGDFFRLEHVEGYLELSTKTKIFFSSAVQIWDADFYVKIDDDIHLNIGALATTLAKHKSKPRVYMGCMKSGPVLSKPGIKYYEPEFWKFGEEGNRYFRHATGQLYVVSKALAIYVSINQPILHKYTNEDVSLGSWFIGLDVEYVDDRSMCCGTPPDCEWRAQAGDICIASFDWPCSGICKSVDRMKDVHERCGEGKSVVWNLTI